MHATSEELQPRTVADSLTYIARSTASRFNDAMLTAVIWAYGLLTTLLNTPRNGIRGLLKGVEKWSEQERELLL